MAECYKGWGADPGRSIKGPHTQRYLIEHAHLSEDDFYSADRPPNYTHDQPDEAKRVVVKISPEEAIASGWKAGYYVLPLTPAAAGRVLRFIV